MASLNLTINSLLVSMSRKRLITTILITMLATALVDQDDQQEDDINITIYSLASQAIGKRPPVDVYDDIYGTVYMKHHCSNEIYIWYIDKGIIYWFYK